MTLFNIGPIEFIAILIIMFLVLGPEGMVKTAYSIGSWIRKTVRSPLWGEILGYSREIRDLPTRIVRESGLDSDLKDIQEAASEATSMAREGLDAASKEINKSMSELGSLEVKMEGNPGIGTAPVVKLSDGTAQGGLPPGQADPPEQTGEAEKPKPPVLLD